MKFKIFLLVILVASGSVKLLNEQNVGVNTASDTLVVLL